MQENLITIETAILAKEKGFDLKVLAFYGEPNKALYQLIEGAPLQTDNYNTKEYRNRISAPTQSLLQQWLRKNHNIDITINRSFSMDNSYHYCIIINGNYDEELQQAVISNRTFETTLEEALISALNLI